MIHTDDYRRLVQGLLDGDADAAAQFWEAFEPAIRRSVRAQLRRQGLPPQDISDDRVQSVAVLFFDRLHRGKLDELIGRLEEPKQMVGLLREMAQGKVVDWIRRQNAQRRDRRKECSLAEAVPEPGGTDTTPSERALRNEQVEKGTSLLNDEERRLTELVRDGKSWKAIAAEFNRSERAVQMQFYRARDRVCAELFDT